jgi:hypothetical protein
MRASERGRIASKLLQPGDLTLALDARRVGVRQPRHKALDPVAQLQGEVGSGGAHQLTHVLDGHIADALPGEA